MMIIVRNNIKLAYTARTLLWKSRRTYYKPTSKNHETIREFYAGKTVFLTGATGFTGKHVLYKLLNSCPELKRVYCLIRPNGKESAENRLAANIISSEIFDQNRTEAEAKVTAISGDLAAIDLGLMPKDRKLLQQESNIVLHVASTVRFDLHLREAYNQITLGMRRITSLAKEMENLESFVFVSTAYSNQIRVSKEVKQGIYSLPTNEETIDQWCTTLPDETVEAIYDKTFRNVGYGNTYQVCKAFAEHIAWKELTGIPVAIVRSPGIGPVWRDPLPGWIDKTQFIGVNVLLIQYGLGNLAVAHFDPGSMPFMPVEVITNGIIAAAWRAVNKAEDSPILYQTCPLIPSGWDWSDAARLMRETFIQLPHPGQSRIPGKACPYVKDEWIFKVRNLFQNKLSAYRKDAIRCLRGQKPMHAKLMRHGLKANRITHPLLSAPFFWHTDNAEALYEEMVDKEKEIFPCTAQTVDWEHYLLTMNWGLRKHLLKEDIDVPERVSSYFNKKCKMGAIQLFNTDGS